MELIQARYKVSREFLEEKEVFKKIFEDFASSFKNSSPEINEVSYCYEIIDYDWKEKVITVNLCNAPIDYVWIQHVPILYFAKENLFIQDLNKHLRFYDYKPEVKDGGSYIGYDNEDFTKDQCTARLKVIR